MGAYNTLVVKSKCANCGEDTILKIQFKYGELWNYSYSLNDEIKFKEDELKGVDKLVVLDGFAEECEYCGQYVNYLIFVEDGIIKSFKKNDGEYDFSDSDGYYLILKSI